MFTGFGETRLFCMKSIGLLPGLLGTIVFPLLLLSVFTTLRSPAKLSDYRYPDLPNEKRVDDLPKRMTVAEKNCTASVSHK